MSRTITVAAVQPHLHWHQPGRNLAHLRRQIDAICAAGPVDIIVLPEHFNATPAEPGTARAGEQLRDFVCGAAGDNSVNIVGGSAECLDDHRRLRNTCFISDRGGRLIGRYDKRRLFGGETGRGVVAGDGDALFELDGLRIGVLICNDLWCPQLAQRVARRADLLCVPAETCVSGPDFRAYARTLWWSLAMTRAHENALPVIVADVAAVTYPRYCDSGASSINDPSRKPDRGAIQLTIPGGRPGHLQADIDLTACAEYREYRRQAGLLEGAPSG